MTAADTSVWIDFTRGADTRTTRLLERFLRDGTLMMPSPVLFEILSGPGLTPEARASFLRLPLLDLRPGFWERAAAMRQALLQKRNKARAMDCMVAQVCIDHDAPLITADADFRRFVAFGLQILS